MKKLIKSALCLLLIISCSKAKNEISSEPVSNSKDTIAAEVKQGPNPDSEKNHEENTDVTTSENCFKTDEDVLQYLIGKTFSYREAYVSFTSDGGSYSGTRDLKWKSYKIEDGKGLVVLSSLSKDCPDCTYTFWVSCEEGTITSPPEEGALVYRNE